MRIIIFTLLFVSLPEALLPQAVLAVAGTSSSRELSGVFSDPGALAAFLGSTAGKAGLMLLFFALVAGFLRLLYGPKGWLREKRWDEMNREYQEEERIRERARQIRLLRKGREKVLEEALAEEIPVFKAYVREFLTGDPERDAMHLLKQEHSLRVLDNARVIAAREDALLPELPSKERKHPLQPDRILLLAALHHDLGRFEQLKRYNTFRDADSIDHARLGSLILRDPRFLAHEKPRLRSLVRLAVAMHNRLNLPARLAPALRPLCQALREADKLDIIRIISAELAPGHAPHSTALLSLIDDPDSCTPAILSAAIQGRPILYRDMRFINDFRLLICGWTSSFTFPTSLRLLAAQGHLLSILNGLPHTPAMNELRDVTMNKLERV